MILRKCEYETGGVLMKRAILTTILSAVMAITGAATVLATDLNDGISSYTDNPIAAADQLGSPDVNVDFIVLRAKSRVYSTNLQDGSVTPAMAPEANINSVVLEPGSSIRGDIIIIDQSTGDKSQVVNGVQRVASGLGIDFGAEDLADAFDGFFP
jgi:hypothetical protein